MIRLLRLPLALLLALGVSLPTAAPIAASGYGCTSGSARPYELFVQGAFGMSEATLFTFYVDGPEYRLIYEGYFPGSFGTWLTGLTPGEYGYYVHYHQLTYDGTYVDATEKLADCTVYGGPVITPPLEKPTAIAVTPIALGTATISWNGGPGTYRVVAKRLNKRGKVQPATKRTCEATLSESGSGSCELLDLRPGRWRIRTTRTFEGATSVRVKVIRITAAKAM